MFSLIISLLLSVITQPVIANEATPSATDSQEIQEIRQVVQEKVKEKLDLIKSPSNKAKSIFGTIEKVEDKNITIKWQDDTNQLILDEETTIISLKRQKMKTSDLKVGQEILAMGYFNQDNNLETKRIVLIEIKKIENNNQVVNGQIVDLSQSAPIFTLIPNSNKNNQYQIESTSKEIKDLSSGQKIIAVIEADPENNNNFNLIKIIKTTDPTSSATPTPEEE